MSHTIEKLAGGPVTVVTYNADYDLTAEGTDTLDGIAALLNTQTEPAYMI